MLKLFIRMDICYLQQPNCYFQQPEGQESFVQAGSEKKNFNCYIKAFFLISLPPSKIQKRGNDNHLEKK